jgi:hypothetical protein
MEPQEKHLRTLLVLELRHSRSRDRDVVIPKRDLLRRDVPYG